MGIKGICCRLLGAAVVIGPTVLGGVGSAGAAVSFDRAFGVGVDTGTATFQNCTTASGCQAGPASGRPGA